MEQAKLPISLNNAIAYSYVLGWYAGRDGAPTDDGKISATEKIKEMHPDVVLACNSHKDLTKQRDVLLAACEAMLVVTDKGEKPRKLDEALTWRQNDELAHGMAEAAIASAS